MVVIHRSKNRDRSYAVFMNETVWKSNTIRTFKQSMREITVLRKAPCRNVDGCTFVAEYKGEKSLRSMFSRVVTMMNRTSY